MDRTQPAISCSLSLHQTWIERNQPSAAPKASTRLGSSATSHQLLLEPPPDLDRAQPAICCSLRLRLTPSSDPCLASSAAPRACADALCPIMSQVTDWPDGGGGTPPSTVSGSYYQWQKWTGPPWLRPSVGAVWDSYNGRSYSLIGVSRGPNRRPWLMAAAAVGGCCRLLAVGCCCWRWRPLPTAAV